MAVKAATKTKGTRVQTRATAANGEDDRLDRAIELMTARMAESHAETDRAIQRMTERIDRLSLEGERVERNIEKMHQNIEKMHQDIVLMSSNYGGIGKSFGELIELIVVPKIRPEMRLYKHNFTRVSVNKVFRFAPDRPGQDIVTEVDMLLYNGTESMAAEIKTSLSVQDVEKHINRLKTLRKYEVKAGLQGKKLFGAVIGVFVDYHARKFATKKGLYLLEIIEEERRMQTSVPPELHVW
ncbi:MAG: hypothetical protein LBB74_05275 [Chitinispirillales bacterium]|jgi:hypothetical protein|nr:hypothetical protein [Chitinispirillales bacterium]